MRVIFAGTPEFARVALEQLHSAGFDIALVLTQADRPAGRGMKLQASPVKAWAQAHRIAVIQPRSLRLDGKYPEDAQAAQLALAQVQADVMVVAAYGLLLPAWVLQAPPLGCLNIHASLLPRWRGAAPIHRAIEAGDTQTGITVMQMDAGLDTGDMLLSQALPILPDDTTASLHDRLAALGGHLMVQALQNPAAWQPVPQAPERPASGITYAHKIDKVEAALDWRQPAVHLARQIRAFNPFPGSTAVLQGTILKLWQAQVLPTPTPALAAAGQIVAAGPSGVDIATGAGVLRVTQLQKPGGKALPAADFLHGFTVLPGTVLGPSV